ncbi:hypothetical protein [Fictibacillus sp. JL2B1089]|uniref:hypothetical protein n=1 Tax=Fictibacillus sp. JL2B1089 TaxID=3399565 RepID=UPI003A8BABBC
MNITLKDLIKEGEEVKSRNMKNSSMGGYYISGEEYEMWIAKCIIFLENNEDEYSSTLIGKFIKASEKAVGNGEEHYNTMMGILKAFDQMEVEA